MRVRVLRRRAPAHKLFTWFCSLCACPAAGLLAVRCMTGAVQTNDMPYMGVSYEDQRPPVLKSN